MSVQTKSISASIERLKWICANVPAHLHRIEEADFSNKHSPQKWSKKEILGHLVDSATNNHHRLVRAQFEECPLITYNQVKWNAAGFYQQSDTRSLINFWEQYNKQIAQLVQKFSEEQWRREVRTGENSVAMSLEAVLIDYVDHLEHHLREITLY